MVFFLQNFDHVYIGGALVIVVVITGLFTYYQVFKHILSMYVKTIFKENKSSKIMESFGKMLPTMTMVNK